MGACHCATLDKEIDMKHTRSTGVLAKDGITPFAPGTLHVITKDGWKTPLAYTPEAMMYAFVSDDVTEIVLINTDNEQHTVIK